MHCSSADALDDSIFAKLQGIKFTGNGLEKAIEYILDIDLGLGHLLMCTLVIRFMPWHW